MFSVPNADGPSKCATDFVDCATQPPKYLPLKQQSVEKREEGDASKS